MNRLLIISILSAALMTSCGHSGPDGQGSSREAEARDHGTELHDHESEGHDHASENHTGHDHEEKEHDHAGEIAFTKEQAARAIEQAGFDVRIRGEKLGLEEFARLADELERMTENG